MWVRHYPRTFLSSWKTLPDKNSLLDFVDNLIGCLCCNVNRHIASDLIRKQSRYRFDTEDNGSRHLHDGSFIVLNSNCLQFLWRDQNHHLYDVTRAWEQISTLTLSQREITLLAILCENCCRRLHKHSENGVDSDFICADCFSVNNLHTFSTFGIQYYCLLYKLYKLVTSISLTDIKYEKKLIIIVYLLLI